jgi:hypothetical protein
VDGYIKDSKKCELLINRNTRQGGTCSNNKLSIHHDNIVTLYALMTNAKNLKDYNI